MVLATTRQLVVLALAFSMGVLGTLGGVSYYVLQVKEVARQSDEITAECIARLTACIYYSERATEAEQECQNDRDGQRTGAPR